MDIAYLEPLSRAWNRMKDALFRPFDINKWFAVGFNAFLAGLLEGHNGSGGSRAEGDDLSFREFLDLPRRGWEWLGDHPGWFIAIIFIAVFLIVLLVVLTWLSSRGQFMFLDNVVQDNKDIAKPWKKYRNEGNSLFVWRLIFGLVCFAGFLAFVFAFFTFGAAVYEASGSTRAPIPFLVLMGFIFLFMIIIIGFISSYLMGFVVPIMYKNHVTTTESWGRFLVLFRQHPFHFILFAIIMFFLNIFVIIMIILVGLLTCCIGFLVLIIPYIGTVVTLPIWYWFRAFSVEYLAQFGPDYRLFPEPELEPAPAAG